MLECGHSPRWGSFGENGPGSDRPIYAKSSLNILLDYLRNNLERTHSIDDLTERVAMSRRTFTRHFSKATGMTLVDWLVNERLRLTRELL